MRRCGTSVRGVLKRIIAETFYCIVGAFEWVKKLGLNLIFSTVRDRNAIDLE